METTYDTLAPVYDLVAAPFEWPLVRRGLELLAPTPGERVLEVGHGTGRALEVLARAVQPGGRVTGVDLSAGMAAQARRRLSRAGLLDCVTLLAADATTLELPPASLDALFSAFTVETFDEARLADALVRWRTWLRPGGRAVLVTMARREAGAMGSLYAWSQRHFPRWVDCRPIAAAELLTAAGFVVDVTQSRSVTGIPVDITRAARHD